MFAMNRSAVKSLTWSWVPDECGVTMTLGRSQIGLSAGSGSGSKTSSVAPAEVAGSKRVDQGGLVEDRSARHVDDIRAARQQRKLPRPDHALRGSAVNGTVHAK